MLAVALIPLLAMGGMVAWTYQAATRRIVTLVGQQESSAAALSGAVIGQTVDSAMASLRLVDRQIGKGKVSEAELRDLELALPTIESIRITDAMGRIWASSIPFAAGERLAWLKIHDFATHPGPAFSRIHRDLYSGQPVLSLAVPRLRAGRYAGVVAASMNLDALRRALAERQVLASGERIELADSAGKTFLLIGSLATEKERLARSARVPGTPWSVVVSQSLGRDFARPWRSAAWETVLLVVTAAIVAAFAVLTSRRIAGSFTGLTQELARFSPNDPRTIPGAEAQGWSSLEYDALRSEFRALAAELSSRFEALEEARRHLEANVAELERADRLKQEFLANVSHELRTPLNHIIAYASSLEDGVFGPLAAKQIEALGILLRSADHLLELVEQLLLLVELEAGTVSVRRDEVDLEPLLQGLREEVEAECERRELVLRWDVAPARVMVDIPKVLRICKILLANAIKFTPAGQQVALSTSATTEGLAIEVSDTGVGIAAEVLARAFDRFYQGDASATRLYGGLGIGLHLASRLVKLLGGAITVRSKPNEGTVASVWLPTFEGCAAAMGPRSSE
ncbi:MAG: hypothetical protein KGR26_02775 [Cyanobacteria bacterium REEB65]|nr:hypothetical protein [Cyanobacteria bacterium REEB65]